ncbi:hypothetical protein CL629_02080 [bacterium]|nr:hypothetical protein [bacterium]|tara:strand:- start:5732 stop:5932 length:201 start_codon:yes stop_codon:yes gene_type:complete
MVDLDKIKRYALLIVYKALRVEVNFAKKCEFCFETFTWRSKEGKFVCEKHMYALIKKNEHYKKRRK